MKKKLLGRKILSIMKLEGEKWDDLVPFGLIPTRGFQTPGYRENFVFKDHYNS